MNVEKLITELFKLPKDALVTVDMGGIYPITKLEMRKNMVVLVESDYEIDKLIEYSEIPKYGNHMTIEKFIDIVDRGGIMDDDGFGYYATASQKSDKYVDCDVDILNEIKADGVFTHVVWYNK